MRRFWAPLKAFSADTAWHACCAFRSRSPCRNGPISDKASQHSHVERKRENPANERVLVRDCIGRNVCVRRRPVGHCRIDIDGGLQGRQRSHGLPRQLRSALGRCAGQRSPRHRKDRGSNAPRRFACNPGPGADHSGRPRTCARPSTCPGARARASTSPRDIDADQHGPRHRHGEDSRRFEGRVDRAGRGDKRAACGFRRNRSISDIVPVLPHGVR
jgi:hypothetical protein